MAAIFKNSRFQVVRYRVSMSIELDLLDGEVIYDDIFLKDGN